MVGFGELHRLSEQWEVDLATVERAYALDWLVRSIFEREQLFDTLALRGPAALSKAYFAEYPQPEAVDLASGLPADQLREEFERAAERAAGESGCRYKLDSVAPTQVRVEYSGPLGRRSAAQPQLVLRFSRAPLRAAPVEKLLLHPFREPFEARVRAAALEELAAELIVNLGRRPRARDVYDLWYILAFGSDRLDQNQLKELVRSIGGPSVKQTRGELAPAHRAVLERAWNNALAGVRPRPDLARAEREIAEKVGELRLNS